MFWTRRVMTVNEQEKLQFDDRLSDVHTSIEGIVSEVKKGYKQWHITNKLLFLGLLCSAGLLLIAIIISTNEYTLIQKASEGLRKGSVVAALSLEDRNFFFFRERALRVFENARKKNTETIDRVMKAFEIKEYQQVIKLVEMSWSATLPLEVENSYAESKRIIAGQKVQAERTRKRLVDLNSAKQACKDGNCRLLFRIVAMYPDDSEFSQLRKTFVGEFTNVSTLVVGGVRKWEDAKRIKRASGKVHMSVSSFSEYIGKRVCAEGVFRVRKAGWFYAGGYFVDTQNELIDMIEICFDKRFDSPERLAWLALKTVLEYVFMEELSTPAMAHLFGRIIVESIHHG